MRLWLLVVLALASPAAAQTQLYLTDAPIEGGEVMQEAMGDSAAVVTFSSAGSLGLGAGADLETSHAWYWPGAWSVDERLLTDVSVTLWMSSPTPSTGTLLLRLDDVAPDGSARTVASTDYDLSISGAAATPTDFLLNIQDPWLQENHTLRFVASVEGLTTAVNIEYGDANTPSGLNFGHAPLDQDGDGILDSDERRQGSNPLDANNPAAPQPATQPFWPPVAAAGLFLACMGAAAAGLFGRHSL